MGYTGRMQALKIIGLLLLACGLAVIALVLLKVTPRIQPTMTPVISNFEECAAAGNPVMESYPRQCRSKDVRLFVEEISDQATSTDAKSGNGCAIAGCSSQLCVSADEASTIITTCEYRSEYACYKNAACEPQADGKCDWTQTPELQTCLAHPPQQDTTPNQLEVQ